MLTIMLLTALLCTRPAWRIILLIKASAEWNAVQDLGKVECNLRTCLFRLVIQELTARLKKLQETPAGISEASKAQWISDSVLTWLHHRWSPEQAKLVLDATQTGIPQNQLVKLLGDMDAALKANPTVLCQFKALRLVGEDMKGESVAFKISVALRGQPAMTLHQGFTVLDGCVALQLIGANLRRERQRQSKEAPRVRLRSPFHQAAESTQCQRMLPQHYCAVTLAHLSSAAGY